MKINQKELDNTVILELHGKLTGGPESEMFRNVFKELLQADKKNIVINLKKVDWINSTGLGILISNYTTVRKGGGDLVLCNIGDRIDSILYVTKLNLLFKTYDSEQAAVDHFKQGSE